MNTSCAHIPNADASNLDDPSADDPDADAPDADAQTDSRTDAAALRYAVAIITFNPEIEALAALCARLAGCGERRQIVDNGSQNVAPLRDLASRWGFELLEQGENLGVAAAANRWVASLPESIAAFALFDQDSLPDEGYCDTLAGRLRAAREGGENFAAVGGRILDAPEDLPIKFLRLGRLRVEELDPGHGDVAPDYLIISGTLFHRPTFVASGGFDEALFVDNVDLEWSYRVRNRGAPLLGTASASLRHRVGDDCLRVPGLRRGLKVHSAPRLRIMTRSRFLSYRRRTIALRWKYHDALRFLAKGGLLLAFHPARGEILRALAGGARDGLHASAAPRLGFETQEMAPTLDRSFPARLRRRLERTLPREFLRTLQRRFMSLHKLRHTRTRKVALFDFLREGEALVFSREDTPAVSIVLVLYNRAELTLACLQSLREHMDVSYEVIIIDNASEDETEPMLNLIEGVEIVRNEDNRGFLLACNQAAELARGDTLLLLNNDSELGANGIGAALETLRGDAGIGAVGAKIQLLDGRLQEAGSIIWSDGSCLGYGRDMDPADPRANFQRDVDYCSGAFLLTPLALFRELGGFDERFAPAYYEETDYCARLWSAGYRVVYEPRTAITHFEFGSSNTGSKAAMEQMERNAVVFRAKHAAFLETRLPPTVAHINRARDHAHDALRILYIDDRVPHQHQGSGFPRSNDVVNVLAASGALLSILPYNFPYEDDVFAPRPDLPPSVEILCGYGRHNVEEFLQERAGFFDAVWISRPHNMKHFQQHLEHPALAGAAIVYDAEAFFAWRDIRKAALKGRPLSEEEQEARLREEGSLLRLADHVVTVSAVENESFQQHGDITAAEISVVGHSLHGTQEAPSFGDGEGYLFVGNLDYCDAPNADSVLWFVKEVWPAIRETQPDATLSVAGSNRCDAIRTLSAPGVTVLGRVDDLAALYRRHRVLVAPTRYAAGIPYKIHDAAAAGVPAVASDLVARQVGWIDSDALLNASVDDPRAFAGACRRLHDDEALWNTVQRCASERLAAECSPTHFADEVNAALHTALARRRENSADARRAAS